MGKPRNTQKYPTYPEIPEIPGNTRKKKRYPEIPDHIFRHSYPTRTRPATRYFVQYPTQPDPILKNPTCWALFSSIKSLMRNWDFVSSFDLHLHLASTNNAAAYYLPLGHGHQTVRAPPEKNCHPQIMRRQQELFGGGSRSGLQNWYSCFCQNVKMVDAGMAGNHVCF